MSLITNWLESLHLDVAITSNCTRQKNRRSTCLVCLENCDEKAISVQDHLVILDLEKCTSCGKCMIACPISAIEGIPAKRKFEKTSLVYDHSYKPLLKEWLIYKKKGMTSILINELPLNQEWQAVLNETNEILALLNEEPLSIKKADEQKLSRREFFTSVQNKSHQLAKTLAPAKWRVDMDGWKLSKYYPEFQFYEVEMNKEKCNMCGVCFSLCPQGVFSLKDFTLTIDNSKCVDCRVCLDVCQEKALCINTNIQAKNDVGVACFQKSCQNCGQLFQTFQHEVGKCPVCVNRDPSWLSP